MVVFYDDAEHIVAHRVSAVFNCNYLAGNGRMNRGGNGCGTVANFLTHLHIVPHCHHRLAGCANMLHHGNDQLVRCRDYRLGNVGRFHIMGMYAAFKRTKHYFTS